jgi:hypothetical protein
VAGLGPEGGRRADLADAHTHGRGVRPRGAAGDDSHRRRVVVGDAVRGGHDVPLVADRAAAEDVERHRNAAVPPGHERDLPRHCRRAVGVDDARRADRTGTRGQRQDQGTGDGGPVEVP